MTLTPVRSRFATTSGLAALLILAGALGWRVAQAMTAGKTIVVVAVAVYLLVLLAVWMVSKGNLVVVVLVAYLLGPAPADNVLPQVNIFPLSDYSVRPRDMLFLADIVLVAALVWLRPALPKTPLLRWWLASLGLLALYPTLFGVWFGAGQAGWALLQGAVMPLRAVGVAWLVAGWVATRGWRDTVKALTRLALIAGAAIAAGALVAVAAAGGELQFTAFGYPLVVDGRPALPGWGNNILANFLCVCVAIAVGCHRIIGWRVRYLVAIVGLLIVGIAFTEVRIAMLLALAIAEIPVVLLIIRRYWPSRGATVALGAGAIAGVLLVLATITVLPVINPRFRTLTPGVIAQHLPQEQQSGNSDRPTFDEATGKDLGGESASTRGKLAKAAGKIWLKKPVFGVGWNGWGWEKSELPVMRPAPLVPLVVGLDPHNGFLWLLAEAGIVGLLLLYGVPLLVMLRKLRLWWLWLGLMVATALEMVNPNLRNGHFAALMWALLTLAMVHTATDVPSDEPDESQRRPAAEARALTLRFLAWLRGADHPQSKECYVGVNN